MQEFITSKKNEIAYWRNRVPDFTILELQNDEYGFRMSCSETEMLLSRLICELQVNNFNIELYCLFLKNLHFVLENMGERK